MTHGMRRIEAQDPRRKLAGFENRIKSAAAIKARIAEHLWAKGGTVEDAIANLTDGVRYTFAYPPGAYANGVRADLLRLDGMGFCEIELRNAWHWPRFKGITSSWREPLSGHLFEVQFHTWQSYAAVQATYDSYQQLRDPGTTDAERAGLTASMERAFAAVPVPPGADFLEDRRKQGHRGTAADIKEHGVR